MDIVKANLDKPWDWDYLSDNENITCDIVEANLDKDWNWDELSRNRMLEYKETFIEELRLKIIKSNIIKRYWRNYSCNPIHPFAQKMILKRAGLS